MKKICILLGVIVSIFFVYEEVNALANTASSSVLVDMDSKRILYQDDKDEQRLIASITKIMTAVVAIENKDINDIVTVGEEVLTMYGSNIYITLGEKMSLKDLLYGLLLRSGNDSAIVIATYVGGTEEKFVELMNEKAKEIGMTNTKFSNSHGLDEVTQNYSTAYDMALLSSYANTLEIYREIVKTKTYRVQSDTKSYYWQNRNKLLTLYEYATGGKTGYTPSAGRTLVTTASKNNLNLTAVTLNDPDEYTSHKELYEYGFEKYKNYRIIEANSKWQDRNYYKDKVYVINSFTYPLTKEEKEKIKVVIKLLKDDDYKNNDEVGVIEVLLDGEVIYSDKVYVEKEEEKNGFFGKIKEFFGNLFG